METRLGTDGRRRMSAGLTLEQPAECSNVSPRYISTIAVLFATLVGGCSDHYQPLTDADFVSIWVRGTNTEILEVDGVVFTASVYACISPNRGGFGFRFLNCYEPRKVPPEYDCDTFIMEDAEYGDYEAPCDPNGTSSWVASMLDAPPGREIRFTVNEYTETKVTMPVVPVLTLPKAGSFVSSGLDLVLEWEPISTGDPMFWLLSRPYYEPGDPCAEVDWGPGGWDREGELQDTGSFVIPKEAFPTGLPDGGCRANVTLKTAHEGSLDPTINAGRIVGDQFYTVEFTLLP
jgi:hypothetical protein